MTSLVSVTARPLISAAMLVTCCIAVLVARLTGSRDMARRWGETWQRSIGVGEFGSWDHAPYASCVTYSRTMRDAMEVRGMTSAYWEFAAGFGNYDPQTKSWKAELRDALFR